jgi:hypothetical protein
VIMTAVAIRPVAATCTGECQKSGPLGLVVIIVLCIGCYFLFKSMSKHLKQVREDYPAQPPADRDRPGPAAPVRSAGGGSAGAGRESAGPAGQQSPPAGSAGAPGGEDD